MYGQGQPAIFVLRYPFKKPGEISEVCVEQENALDSNFGNFLPQNIEMILKKVYP
jgi:hypothetical protein